MNAGPGRRGAARWCATSRRTLIYLANQACIELHVLLSRVAALDRADQLVFDLDPPAEAAFGEARRYALNLRASCLRELGLAAYVKTTGGKGLHVHVPLRAARGFDQVRELRPRGRRADGPPRIRLASTVQQRDDQRGKRLYLDLQRNGYAQMAMAPYSVRPRARVTPVSYPAACGRGQAGGLNPRRFTCSTRGIGSRSRQTHKAGPGTRHSLTAARRHLKSLSRTTGRVAISVEYPERAAALPSWVEPQLATLTHERFSVPEWIYERKLDGERCLAFCGRDSVSLKSRNKQRDQQDLPRDRRGTGHSGARRAGCVDGEVVAFDGAQTRFERLQQRLGLASPAAAAA